MPVKELKRLLKRDAKEFASLYEIGRFLTSTFDLKEVLNLITKRVAGVMKADVSTLRLLEGKERLVLRAAYGLNAEAMDLKKDIRIDENYAVVKVAKEARAVIVKDLLKDAKYEHKPFAQSRKLKSLISVPLIEMNNVIGVLSLYSRKGNFYKDADKRMLALFAFQAAVAIENARLFEKTRSNYINTMRFFASIIDVKDSYTADHSNRVMKNVLRLADKMDLSSRQKEVLQYASFLHDIGKLSIDASILAKEGPLSDEDWKQIVKHPVVGSNIIKKIGFLDDLIPVVLHHHERYGGGGYPNGDMKGKEIPLEARILAVADAYEAMTSDRPYRRALSEEDAIKELKSNSGNQFDPRIVELFLDVLKKPK